MKFIVIISLMFLQWNVSDAQKINEFFNSSKVSVDFVGLDFSKTKLVGAEGFTDPQKIQSYYFPAWNNLLFSEMDKYSIKGAFYKSDVNYELGVVESVNQDVEYIDLVTEVAPPEFTDKDLQKIVKTYNTNDLKNSYGISFVVHSLNKLQESASIYVVVFNPKNKKVLFSKRLSGAARGFGFRNYWAGAVYNILKQIRKQKFKSWRKQYK